MSANCEFPLQIFQFLLESPDLPAACAVQLMEPTSPYEISLLEYLKYFVLTCVFESVFYFWALRGQKWKARFTALVFCNLATHPIVIFVAPRIVEALGGYRWHEALGSEIFAPTLEALLLQGVWKCSWPVALITAFLANIFSWWFGGWLVSQF